MKFVRIIHYYSKLFTGVLTKQPRFGAEGKLAIAFADVMSSLAEGRSTAVAPKDFKMVVGAELTAGEGWVGGACMLQQTLRGSFSAVSKRIFATK